MIRSQFVIVQCCQLMLPFPVPITPVCTTSAIKTSICFCVSLSICLLAVVPCMVLDLTTVYSCISARASSVIFRN